jgi:hypothetical protein
MPSIVYYASPHQARLDANETLPIKLDRIVDRLAIRDRVKGEHVAIKMHLGGNVGYSTLHPVFVRRVVKAVKDGGGKPFIVDLNWSAVDAAERGYTAETLGCSIFPTGGLDENYYYRHTRPFKNITEWLVGGGIQDASFLIDLAHLKGHPSCGYGGAFKNLALGCMMQATRSAMHDTCHVDPYWFPELCPDPQIREAIIASCPHGAVVQDKQNPDGLHLHIENCNQCGRCVEVAPPGSWKIDPVNFHAFQEACAIVEPGADVRVRHRLSALSGAITPFGSLCNVESHRPPRPPNLHRPRSSPPISAPQSPGCSPQPTRCRPSAESCRYRRPPSRHLGIPSRRSSSCRLWGCSPGSSQHHPSA